MLDAASGRREAITVFGTDWPTPDGTCIRDFVHVADLAEAHVLGLGWLLARGGDEGGDGGDGDGGGGPLALNLGSGTGHSVRAVIAAARAVTGADIPVIEGPRRPGDPARLVSGSGLARQVLGWRPRRSGLDSMVADAWAWHQTGGYG